MTEIELIKGDDLTLQYIIKDKYTKEPVDLTGSSFKFTVKEDKTKPDSEALFQLTSAVSTEIMIVDATNGILEVYIKATHTKNATSGIYYFDLEETTSTGKVYTRDLGEIEIIEDVTKGV